MSSSFIGSFLIGQKVGELETALAAANAQIETAKTDITVNAGKTSELQTWASDRVKYAYPNGGSEGSEATLDLSSVYFCDSPFSAGAKYTCFSEYFSTNLMEWVELQSTIYSLGGFGVMAYSRSTQNQVVLTTGKVRLVDNAENGVGWYVPGDLIAQSLLKWRVRCVRED